jgi:AraC-like DNA-binding protein
MTLDWIWYLTLSMLIMSICAFIINGVIVISDFADWIQLRFVILTLAVIWVLTLGYYGVRRTSFFNAFPLYPEEEGKGAKESQHKYEKNKLKDDLLPEYKNKLMQFMDEEQPYLNSRLTINQLASSIEIPVHHLSQILNEKIGQNFFEFINSYRVSEVKKRFLNPEYKNLTLLGIALESGFNSKASFNRIFKQMTQQTPTEFIKDQKAA